MPPARTSARPAGASITAKDAGRPYPASRPGPEIHVARDGVSNRDSDDSVDPYDGYDSLDEFENDSEDEIEAEYDSYEEDSDDPTSDVREGQHRPPQPERARQSVRTGSGSTRAPAGKRDPAISNSKSQPATSASLSATGAPKKGSDRPHMILQIRLLGTTTPTITRTLVVPSDMTFRKLHVAIQTAFGWASAKHDYHVHNFSVALLEDGRRRKRTDLRTVMHIDDQPTFDDWGPPDQEQRRETETTLEQVYNNPAYAGAAVNVVYEYDLGDGWAHELLYLGPASPSLWQQLELNADVEVFCTAGEGHPCAEDCGGAMAWEDLKDLFRSGGNRVEGGYSRKDWYKKHCMNGDRNGLDPYKWDIVKVNKALKKITV